MYVLSVPDRDGGGFKATFEIVFSIFGDLWFSSLLQPVFLSLHFENITYFNDLLRFYLFPNKIEQISILCL